MVKHEIKVEFSKTEQLSNLINRAYFLEGDSGKILKKNHYLSITPENDVDYSIFKGMDGVTVKLHNDDIIDGNMRFIVEEVSDEVRLYPIAAYAVKEGNLYSFY